MKKRIISIFLIVSIIVSVCAIGMTSFSAATCNAKVPKVISVVPYNGKLNVNWSHDGKNTKLYCVALHEFGTPTNKWIYYYTKNSKTKYLNITGLKSYKNYDLRVKAYDLNNTWSNPSNEKVVINWNASISGTYSRVNKSVNLRFGKQFYYPADYLGGKEYGSYYIIEKYINGSRVDTIYTDSNWYSEYLPKDSYPYYRVQFVKVMHYKEYKSGWSKFFYT